MKKYVLTTYDRGAKSKAYVDASAAVKDWMEFAQRREQDYAEWRDAFKNEGHLAYVSYAGEFMDRCAFLTIVEIY